MLPSTTIVSPTAPTLPAVTQELQTDNPEEPSPLLALPSILLGRSFAYLSSTDIANWNVAGKAAHFLLPNIISHDSERSEIFTRHFFNKKNYQPLQRFVGRLCESKYKTTKLYLEIHHFDMQAAGVLQKIQDKFALAICLSNRSFLATQLRIYLFACPNIEYLEIRQSNIPAEQMALLPFPPSLKELRLDRCYVNDAVFQRIFQHCPDLETLYLHGCGYNPSTNTVCFIPPKYLKDVFINATLVHPDMVKAIFSTCQKLTHFSLYPTVPIQLPGTTVSIPASLRSFHFDGCDEALLSQVLSRCTKLEVLNLSYSERTISDGFLASADFPASLKRIELENRSDPMIIHAICRSCPKLEVMTLHTCTNLAAAFATASLPDSLIELHLLETLLENPESARNIFTSCPNLRRISLEAAETDNLKQYLNMLTAFFEAIPAGLEEVELRTFVDDDFAEEVENLRKKHPDLKLILN